jgi:hypothetical protein
VNLFIFAIVLCLLSFVSKCIPFQSKYIRKRRRESPIFAM